MFRCPNVKQQLTVDMYGVPLTRKLYLDAWIWCANYGYEWVTPHKENKYLGAWMWSPNCGYEWDPPYKEIIFRCPDVVPQL